MRSLKSFEKLLNSLNHWNWTVHECTIYSWLGQIMRLEKKKKKIRKRSLGFNGKRWIQTGTLYALSDFQVLVQKSLTEHPSLCMEIFVLTVLPLTTSTQPYSVCLWESWPAQPRQANQTLWESKEAAEWFSNCAFF